MNDHRTVLMRGTLSFVCFYLLLGIGMFLPAGIGWTRGWIFLAVFFLQMVLTALYACTNPEIFAARSKIQKGTKGWDWVLFFFLEALILAMFPVRVRQPSPLVVSPVVAHRSRVRLHDHRHGRKRLGVGRQ